MGRSRITILQMALLGCLALPAAAQTQRQSPMTSDRPGVYCGAQTVGRGVFHIETGFSYDRQDENRVLAEGWFFPMVFRYGLVDAVELRLRTAGPGRVRVRSEGLAAAESGFASPIVEVKWKFLDMEDARLALLVSADLEAGSRVFRPAGTQPAVNFASDLDLGSGFSMNTNLGVVAAADAERGDRFARSFYNLALWRSLSPSASLFIESFGVYPHQRDGEWQNLVNGGFAYLVSHDLQLDISLARGLTSQTPDWTLATGISLRFY